MTGLFRKLAAVLRGEADEELLATYDEERRPVARFTAEQAYARYVARAAPSLKEFGVEPTVSDANIDLGYRYQSSAIVSESQDPFEVQGDPREAGGLPGTRAPHHVLERDGERISTLDLFSTRAVVLASPGGGAWAQFADAAAARLDTQVDTHVIGDDLLDVEGGFAQRYGLSDSGAVLVRPDGIVAWRAESLEEPAEGVLAALGALLGRANATAGSA